MNLKELAETVKTMGGKLHISDKPFTDQDRAAMRKAQEKRDRKQAKRIKDGLVRESL